VGDFKHGGREWQSKGQPERVRVHDFEIREPGKGKVAPYGVYDLGRNVGWVSVGVDHDTAAFAVESIRRWWRSMGRPSYPKAKRLLITADSGGSNGARARLWKCELQQLSDETGLEISVCHFPPGTSKWNKIEHRLFLLHQPELAGQAANQSRSDHQPHRRQYLENRFDRQERSRFKHLSERGQSIRSTDGRTPTQKGHLPWRLELQSAIQKLIQLFVDVPLGSSSNRL
jgi:hypothetical protein